MIAMGRRPGLRLCAVMMFVALAAEPVAAQAQFPQSDGSVLDGSGLRILPDLAPAPSAPEVATASAGAVLRWLDKMSGQVADLVLAPQETGLAGNLEVTLGECRYPVEDPASNAYAFLTIRDRGVDAPLFDGWMIADSPALSVLDHPRYDVWLLRCVTTSKGDDPRP
jgi:hypothetical protein